MITFFNPKKGIPSLAAAPLQCWALLLCEYDYNITFKYSKENGNADGLSRLPLPSSQPALGEEGVTIFNVAQIQALLLTFHDIKLATKCDATLSSVLDHVKTEWPKEVPNNVQPYVQRQTELSVENDCLLWEARVVIPTSLQDTLLKSLHDNHPGITSMKSLPRSYFWWFGVDKVIENLGKSCESCQVVKLNATATPLHPWVRPDAPWTRIHVNYAGPLLGKMLFVVVHIHSKWPEVLIVNSTTSNDSLYKRLSYRKRFR